ncbi:MAG: hypothetical protein AAFU03_10910, partial [Bacteroidota bacterium]
DTLSFCADTAMVTVMENFDAVTVNIVDPDVLNCTDSIITLDASGSEQSNSVVYFWSTSDGNLLGGSNTFTPQVSEPGTYQLLIRDTLTGCENSAVVVVEADLQDPTAVVGMNVELDCTVSSIVLSGSGSSIGDTISYLWETTDGTIVGGSNTLTATVSTAGTYLLTVQNTLNGCLASDEVTVTENVDRPVVQAIVNDQLDCNTSSLTIDATGSSTGGDFTFSWATDVGNFLSGANSLNPIVDAPGNYTLTIANTDNGCVDSFTVSVAIDTIAPFAVAGADSTLTCLTRDLQLVADTSANVPGLTYTWSTVNGNIVSEEGRTIGVDQAGAYQLTVVNLSNGCSSMDEVLIAENTVLPTVDAGPSFTLNCRDSTVVLGGMATSMGNNFVYSWSTENGSFTSFVDSTFAQTDSPGDYQLLVTDTSNGCVDSATVSIAQNISFPSIQLEAMDTLNCFRPTIELAAQAFSNFPINTSWQTDDGLILSGDTTLNPTIGQGGIYQLIVENRLNFCWSVASIQVEEDFVPPVAIGGIGGTIDCIDSILLLDPMGSSMGSIFEYTWLTSNGNILSALDTVSPFVDQAGLYNFSILNTQNGCTAEAAFMVDENVMSPTADAGPDQLLTCLDTMYNLGGNSTSTGSMFSYTWETQDGVLPTNSTVRNVLIQQPGTY